MNVATKQRLVGTIVLVSLAVILIPLLLDGEGVEPPPAAITQTIPPAPIVDTTPLPEPSRPPIVADNGAVNTDSAVPQAADAAAVTDAVPPDLSEQAAEPPALTTITPVPDADTLPEPESAPPTEPVAAAQPEAEEQVAVNAPQLDAQGLPGAWTVQMGMFSDKANAEALLARLLLANYKAYLRPQGGGLSGVFVGPLLTRAEATTLQREMQQEFGEGLVIRFTIDPQQ